MRRDDWRLRIAWRCLAVALTLHALQIVLAAFGVR
jgi:hypothetical protein